MSVEQQQNKSESNTTNNDNSLLQPPTSLVSPNRSSSSLVSDLNLQFIKKLNRQLYSPGQETNEDVYTGRPKIG